MVGTVADAIRDLDQRIALMADSVKRPSREESPVKLDDLKERLDALLAKGPQAPAPPARIDRTASLDAALRSLESRIDSAKARLIADSSNPPPATPDTSLPECVILTFENEVAILTLGSESEPVVAPTLRRMDSLDGGLGTLETAAARGKYVAWWFAGPIRGCSRPGGLAPEAPAPR